MFEEQRAVNDSLLALLPVSVQVFFMGPFSVCIVVLGIVATLATAALSWIASWYPI